MPSMNIFLLRSACLLVFSSFFCLAAPLEHLVSVPGSSVRYGAGPMPFSRADVIYTNHPAFDIGDIWNFLDGNPDTVARTPEINPAAIEFALRKPVSFSAVKIILIGCGHTYSFAVADSVKDLKARSGSYRVLSQGYTPDGTIVFITNSPVSASAFRIDTTRKEGDDYVHFYAIQFLQPVTVTKLIGDYKIRQEHGGEPAVYEPLTMESTRAVDSLLNVRVRAVTSLGITNDVTALADIKYASKFARPFNGGPRLELTKPEKIKVSIRLGDMKKHGVVTVTPRPVLNNQNDIDVLFVERLPRIDFDGPNGGWPTNGQPVVWRAHVKNWGEKNVRVPYRWLLDGSIVAKGKQVVKAGKTALIDYPAAWSHKRQTLRFETDVLPDELVKHNNFTEFVTDALTVGLYVEQSIDDYYHNTQYQLDLDDANSFADWGRRQVRQWNRMLANAVFPQTPSGCYDRIRLDLVQVVPDTALPMKGGLPSNNPNNDDKTVDLIWGFPYKFDQIDGDWFSIPKTVEALKKDEWRPMFMELSLIHELGHARYLIDGYGFDVHTGPTNHLNILVTDDSGASILGTYLKKDGIVSWNKYPGLMGGDYHQLSLFDAVMLNRVAGRRARGGNYNGPEVIGEFLQDIPEHFIVRFRGPHDEIISNAAVKIYWAGRHEGDWYGKTYDNIPDREYSTDANGDLTADKFLFSPDGKIVHTYGWANSKPLVRIDFNGKSYYLFLEISELNIIANTTSQDVPVLDMTVPLRTGNPEPLDPSYGRYPLADWRTVTPFIPLK